MGVLASLRIVLIFIDLNILFRMDDGSQRMYYTGQGPGGSTAIGVAKCEFGEKEWVREQASIVFSTV